MEYWSWLIGRGVVKGGWRRFLDRWLLLHLVAGYLLATAVKTDIKSAANAVLLPLAGALIGLCFAWGGNAQTLLQTEEIEQLAKHRAGGLREYAFVYQTAILVVMACVVLWGIAGLGVFDDTWPKSSSKWYFAAKFVLFFVCSLALRECWQVVLGAQKFLLLRASIRDRKSQGTSPPQ